MVKSADSWGRERGGWLRIGCKLVVRNYGCLVKRGKRENEAFARLEVPSHAAYSFLCTLILTRFQALVSKSGVKCQLGVSSNGVFSPVNLSVSCCASLDGVVSKIGANVYFRPFPMFGNVPQNARNQRSMNQRRKPAFLPFVYFVETGVSPFVLIYSLLQTTEI